MPRRRIFVVIVAVGLLVETLIPGPVQAAPTCVVGRTTFTVTLTGSGVIVGTPGIDVIRGSRGRDVITSLEGDDVVCPTVGNDIVVALPGMDRLYGGTGDDKLGGSDFLYPEDQLAGEAGNNHLLATGDTATADCETTIGVP